MKNIEHIGIAVKDLQVSIPLFETLLNTLCYKKEFVESEKVETAFFKINHTKIELVSSVSTENVISKFLEKKGDGVHHIAFEVEDIYEEMERLKLLGFRFINETPKLGADNKIVCFLYPKETNGVLIELCQEIDK